MSKNEFKKIVVCAQKTVEKSAESKERTEDFTTKYGTLTQNDLQKRFTI
jgi:hypothetical protein